MTVAEWYHGRMTLRQWVNLWRAGCDLTGEPFSLAAAIRAWTAPVA